MRRLVVIDHTEPRWAERYRKSFTVNGRENGAATYSRELVQFQVPVLRRWLQKNKLTGIVSTCPLLANVEGVEGQYDIALQYLHTYTRSDPLKEARETVERAKHYAKRIVFITAYRVLEQELNRNGYHAIFVPGSIDTERVKKFTQPKIDKPRRAIYFGNVTTAKEKMFRELYAEFNRAGWSLDVLSGSRLNSGKLRTQEQAWEMVSTYQYGIGVGRCALEMGALGLKVMYAGANFGGIVTNERQWEEKLEVNLSGANALFSRHIDTSIRLFDLSLVKTSDSRDAAKILRQNLTTLYNEIKG